MQGIKSLLKLFVPPIFTKVSKTFSASTNSKVLWRGDFNSWEEAKKNCDGYDKMLILEKCKNALLKVKVGEAAYERDSVLFKSKRYNWPLIAALQRAALQSDGILSVVDFGGSLGSSYYQNRDFLNGFQKIMWHIVEQRHFAECGKEYFENEELKFFDDLNLAVESSSPNIIILSSVLQYLEKPYEVIADLARLKAPFIFVDITTFVDSSSDRLTVQQVPPSIYDASYPAWFFNEENFKNRLAKCGYEVLTRWKATYKINIGYHAGFLMRRYEV